MREIVVARNVLDPTSWQSHDDVESISSFLQEQFGPALPPHTRFYHQSVDQEHDVTPRDEAGCNALEALPGPLYIVCYPQDPATGTYIGANAFLFITSLILGQIGKKDKKDPNKPPLRGSQNNALNNRQNTARVLGRIPDIFGNVRATPDLIAKPLITYENNLEVELAVMVLGRGEYDVVAGNVFEGDSPANTVDGLSVEIYPPGAPPGVGGGTPQLTIGTPIGSSIQTIYQAEAVNGQVLPAFNALTMHGTTAISQPDSSTIIYALMAFGADPGGAIGYISVPYIEDPSEITDLVQVGDTLECRYDIHGVSRLQFGENNKSTATRGANFTDDLDFTGTGFNPNLADNNLGYVVLALTPFTLTGVNYVEIKIAIPSSLQAQWAQVLVFNPPAAGFYNSRCLLTPRQRASDGNFKALIGPFFVNDPNMQYLSLNFVADQGLFVDDGNSVYAQDQKIQVFVAPADINGNATGAFEEQTVTMHGSRVDTSTRALTATFTPTTFAGGRCLVACIKQYMDMFRVDDPGQGFIYSTVQPIFFPSPLPLGGAYPSSFWNPILDYASSQATGTVQNQVRWTHLYSVSDSGIFTLGDNTLVMARTVQQRGTRNQNNTRKLSIQCTRKTNHWNGTAFVGPLTPQVLGKNIFFHILKDSLLGNIADSLIDFQGISDAFDAVDAYFSDLVTNFAGTFDSENSTLEDMLTQIANSCFLTAYREGGVIKCKPKLAVDNAILLFNHRNILPGTEQRTVAFGTEADYDGAKVDYFDDASNTIKTVTVPTNSATRPLQVTVSGVRDPVRAAYHAWRAYNKVLYQNTHVEFEALQEAALCIIDDKVLVADTTRPETQSGEIVGVSGLILTTSQNVDTSLPAGYQVFLQHTDGTVEGINAAALDNRHLALVSAPSVALVTDPAQGVRTGYTLVSGVDSRSSGFLVESKQAQSRMTWQMSATNYSAGYYFADGLETWILPKINLLKDLSPYNRILTVTGSVPVFIDGTRGFVIDSGAGVGSFITPTNTAGTLGVSAYASYTKSLWLLKAGPGTTLSVMTSLTGSNNDQFYVDTAGNVLGVHGGTVAINYPGYPTGSWHHLALTYDSIALRMQLYLDGVLVATANSLPVTGFKADMQFFDGLVGKIDDARLYLRCLSAEDVRELYRRTIL